MKEEFTELDDRQLRSELNSVEVPAGLRERILVRLVAASASWNDSAQAEAARADSAVALDPGELTSHDSSQQTVALGEPREVVVSSNRARRNRLLGLAMAISLVGLLFGFYHFSRPLSPERLASHCLAQLDRLRAPGAVWQSSMQGKLADLGILQGQLKLNIRPLGLQDQSAGPIAQSCRIWELFSNETNKRFYVFDFREPVNVQKLTRQLQSIKQVSGGWSLVAMRSGDRLLVVAFEGPIEGYLHRVQAA